jgi:hypothetical protein
MENPANTESRIAENFSNTERWVIENLANTESRVTKNLINTKNRVVHDSGGKKPEEGKGGAPRKRPAPQWCSRGITNTQKCRLQKMRQRELAEKKKRNSGTIGLTVYGL